MASDGKAKSGSQKKRRLEEEAAEKARERERRADEYSKWRASQVADLERQKAGKAQAPAAPAASGGASGQGGDSCSALQFCPSAPHASLTAPPSAAPATVVVGRVSSGVQPQQSSLLSFIRAKPLPHQQAEAPGVAAACENGVEMTAPCHAERAHTDATTAACEPSPLGAADMRERLAAAAEARSAWERARESECTAAADAAEGGGGGGGGACGEPLAAEA